MKIAVVIPNLRGAGCERIVSELLLRLATTDEVWLVSYDRVADYPIPASIKWVALGSRNAAARSLITKTLRFVWRCVKLALLLRRLQPWVILSFIDTCNFVTYGAVKLSGVSARHICAEHTLGESFFQHNEHARRYRVLLYWMSRFVYTKADAVIVISDAMRRFIRTTIGVARPMYRIYNGFDTTRFYPSISFIESAPARARLSPRLLCVGRLDQNKNQEFVLRAFHQIKSQIPGATLTIVGEGDQIGQLEKMVQELNLADSVQFAGWSSTIETFYRSADLLLHASRYESFGNVLVEGFLCGLPAVVTPASDAYAEVFFRDECGLVTRTANIEEFVSGVINVLGSSSSDAQARLRLAGGARDRFQLAATVDGYRRVLAEPSMTHRPACDDASGMY